MGWAANGNGNEPSWLWIMALATPILAFVGAFVGRVISRSASKELDQWRRREETMRLLRWAAELAAHERAESSRKPGISVLRQLLNSELLQQEDQLLVRGTLDAVVDHWLERMTRLDE